MATKRRAKRNNPSPASTASDAPVLVVKAGVFKNQCLELLDRVHARAIEVVVTKHGTPVARVVPVDVAGPSAFGFLRGTVVHQGDIVSPDFDAWTESE